MTPLSNEILTLQNLLAERDQQIQSLRNAVDRLENSRIEIVLDQALNHGRLTPAERTFWNEQLKRDFDTRFDELKTRPEVMHTAANSVTTNLPKIHVDLSNEQSRRHVLQELVAAKQKLGLSYDDAWSALKHQHPELFAAMSGNQ